ncbi:MAG TPA: cytochrome c [Vicinamibacterales bacterium]|nr:cytochrome c [Vicinamibacterales bacterium]
MPNRFMTKRTLAVAAAVSALMLPSLAMAGQDAKRGQQVYTAQKCQGCHNIGGKGYKTNTLDGVGKKLSAADIRAWIVTPKAMATKTKATGKPPMPERYAKLPAADIDALVAYMQSLK